MHHRGGANAHAKVQEICDLLKSEALEPAAKEAKEIVDRAHREAVLIIEGAKKEADRLQKATEEHLRKVLQVHELSIQSATRKGLATLRQRVEALFAKDLGLEVEAVLHRPDLVAEAIRVILGELEKEGLSSNLSILLPKKLNLEALCHHLIQKFAERVKKSSVQIEGISSGVEIKVVDKKMVFACTDEAVRELLGSCIAPELRKRLFSGGYSND